MTLQAESLTSGEVQAFLAGQEQAAEGVLASLKELAKTDPIAAGRLARELAIRFLRGKKPMSKSVVDDIWKACKKFEAFGYARRVLGRRVNGWKQIISDSDDDAKTSLLLRQQYALCTSKDADLSAAMRHDWALKILQADRHTPLSPNDKDYSETQGIAGGIWKRRWEWDGSRASLEQSLEYYRRGMPENPATDDGYCAINYAFVLDLLASLMRDVQTAADYRKRAKEIRGKIVGASLDSKESWVKATLCEAHLGLGQLEPAAKNLKSYIDSGPATWQLETTLRQLVRLADLCKIPDDSVKALLNEGFHATANHVREAARQSVLVGRVGLALSGGGFRASLYHLGVLARLAESDVLRHVEVLSCVSGGSIVGAHYYLCLRRRLEDKGEQLTQQDYVDVVQTVIQEFVEGVERNVRTRVLASPGNAYAITSGNDKKYADAVSRNLHEAFYERLVPEKTLLSDLLVNPKEQPENFHPGRHNWTRKNKVPVLVLNAATLNTGHSWQFTARSMGESPFSIQSAVDSNPRLRRPNYHLTMEDRRVKLRDAVAASACVPGLFAPLQLDKLYKGYKVRLVDGGVFDNQGAASLLEQDCQVLLVSDAAGQLFSESASGGGHVSPLQRSLSIFQERIRQSGYEGLLKRKEAGQVRGLAYSHLTQGLGQRAIDWEGCEDPLEANDHLPDDADNQFGTGYGVAKELQWALARIRTDLDVFSGVECAALMASGYQSMDAQLGRLFQQVPALRVVVGDEVKSKVKTETWFFSRLLPVMSGPEHDSAAYGKLKRHLEAAAHGIGRSALLNARIKALCVVLGLAMLGLGVALAWQYKDVELLSVGDLAWGLGVLLLPIVLPLLLPSIRGEWVSLVLDPRRLYNVPKRSALLAVPLVIFANVVIFLDRGYIERGRVEKLFGKA